MPTNVVSYQYPRIAARSRNYSLLANGQAVPVLHTNVADFVAFECDDEVRIEVQMVDTVAAAPVRLTVRPLAKGITPSTDGRHFAFTIAGPTNLMLDFEGAKPLLLYANPPETANPRSRAGVRYFRAGQVYEVGELRLDRGEQLYVEGGAIVRGCIRASDADGLVLGGRGVIDGSFYLGERGRRTVIVENSHDVSIHDLIVMNPTTWMTVLGACDGVNIRNYHEIGECVGSDGIDIVGSRNVHIEDCCLKNNDDCIVVKAADSRGWDTSVRHDWARDVENVLVERCVFMNDRAGNVLEVGHELRTSTIRNIVFRDCDSLHCHGNGAVFSIHAGDRATVSNVTFENIRVEHYWAMLVDFRVMRSRFNHDEQRGQIRDVTLRNVDVLQSASNPGYSISVVGGWDKDHTVDGVLFENLVLGGKKVTNGDELDLHTKHAHNIVFR